MLHVRRLAFGIAFATLYAAACTTGSEPDQDFERTQETIDEGGDPSACAQPPSQGVSQPCCEARGVDACGAKLFCAAFDGRTVATCYLERSREDGEQCTQDRQCASQSCNTDLGACRALPGSNCTAMLGCAPFEGRGYVCVGRQCTVSTGKSNAACGTAQDCVSNICVDSRCATGTSGSNCNGPDDCASGRCVRSRCTSGANGSLCTDDSDCSSSACVEGTCTEGAIGDPCERPAQCKRGTCARRRAESLFSYEPVRVATGNVCIAPCQNSCPAGQTCVKHCARCFGLLEGLHLGTLQRRLALHGRSGALPH